MTEEEREIVQLKLLVEQLKTLLETYRKQAREDRKQLEDEWYYRGYDAAQADGWRKCAEGQSTTQYCGLLQSTRKAEREECASIADQHSAPIVASKIRARGVK